MKLLNDHIEIDAETCGGKPRVTGRRITVQDIVIWHERLGLGVDEIAEQYDLDQAEIHAALTYYFDNREDVDNSIHRSESLVEELKKTTPSKIENR